MTAHIAAFDCQVLKRDKLHVEGILKYSIRILLRKNNQMASNVPKKNPRMSINSSRTFPTKLGKTLIFFFKLFTPALLKVNIDELIKIIDL